jgi:NTP pyrophosphatase (non-canonical NTP hydrolase)
MTIRERATVHSKEWWALQKFGKLRILHPVDLNPHSHAKHVFVCECGKHKTVQVSSVTRGQTKSCGQCSIMPKEWWITQKFGQLRLRHPKQLSTGSKDRELFVCDCGKEQLIAIYDVVHNKIVTCGRCNEMDPEWWTSQRFGCLRLETPRALNRHAKQKTMFLCDCGSKKEISIQSVTSGRTRNCGHCSRTVRNWYNKNRQALQALRAPVEPKNFPPGGPIPLGRILTNSKGFKAKCPICGSIYTPSISRLKGGHGLTCGCADYQIPIPCYRIADQLIAHGYSVVFEHKLYGHKYDMFVNESQTLIEFNRSNDARRRNTKKRFLAEVSGLKFLTIEENDWIHNKKSVMQSLLLELDTRKRIGRSYRTKAELRAKLDEISEIMQISLPEETEAALIKRRDALIHELRHSYEDIVTAAINAHHVICRVKNMDPDAAYGNDPFIYYALGLVGESGELAGALLRAIRNGDTVEAKKAAIESEIADSLIYAVILAYTTDIDLIRVVSEKAKIVETRALAGYYGGPLVTRLLQKRNSKL